MKALPRGLKSNRRVLIIAGVVVLVLALIGYVFWGMTTWANYHTSYGQRKDEVRASIDAALKLPTSNAKERAAKLTALSSVSDRITSQDKLCTVNGMIGWQQSFNGSYKKWRQECESIQNSIDSLNGELDVVATYMKSEQALAGLLSTALAATDKKVAETSFSAVLAKWKAALAAVKEMDVSTEFTPVKAKAQKVVSNVEAAWGALIAAHAAKDEAKYEKALTSLSSAYSAIADIERVSVEQVTVLSKTVQSRYDAAF